MITTSASALILVGASVFQCRSCFNKRGLDGSIYDSGLVHQISLSNLAGEYASINTTDEIICTLGGTN